MSSEIEMENRPTNLREESTQVIQTTVNKFFDRTSLPAVPVIRGSTSSWRKFLWMAFIILGFSMAIYQSIDLIEGYRKYRTLSLTSEKINSSIPFPTITVCPSMPILWERAKRRNHSIYEYFKDKKIPTYRDYIEAWSNNTELKDPFDDLLDKILQLNETDRMSLLPEVQNVILSIFHPKQFNLLEDFTIETYIPAFGKCFTFNHGLPGSKQLFIKSTEYVEFLIYDDEKNKPPPNKNVGILLNLHTPGTSPEFHSGTLLFVKGKQDIYVTITRHEVNRLPSPYPSKCVDGTEAERRKKNPFYTPERPYLYTRRACKEKSMQKAFMKLENCLVPDFPLTNDTDINKTCTAEVLEEEDIPEAKNCPLTCHQMSYKWTPVVTYSPAKEGYVNDFCEYAAENSLKEYLEEMGTTKDEFKDGVSRIVFKIQSGLYISHTEHPKYTFSDILGAIGGNIGLWIGISIVSFFEVCELIFIIILKVIRLIGRKCWGGIKKATGYSGRQG